jgi:hypothetical protein
VTDFNKEIYTYEPFKDALSISECIAFDEEWLVNKALDRSEKEALCQILGTIPRFLWNTEQDHETISQDDRPETKIGSPEYEVVIQLTRQLRSI